MTASLQATQKKTLLVWSARKPSPQPQALPLGDDNATQSCHSEAPQCLGGPAQSSSAGLGKRINSLLYRRIARRSKQTHMHNFFMCDLLYLCMYNECFLHNALTGLKSNNLRRHSKVRLVSKWHGFAYRQSGLLPCGSWKFPGDSRRHTNTSSPLGHESPPPADATRWSSLHGSSTLQAKHMIV